VVGKAQERKVRGGGKRRKKNQKETTGPHSEFALQGECKEGRIPRSRRLIWQPLQRKKGGKNLYRRISSQMKNLDIRLERGQKGKRCIPDLSRDFKKRKEKRKSKGRGGKKTLPNPLGVFLWHG